MFTTNDLLHTFLDIEILKNVKGIQILGYIILLWVKCVHCMRPFKPILLGDNVN
jgi:hypothetical protein